jgi:predicted nuclease with TOPRIM domain
MIDPGPPATPDPGRSREAREIWGEQLLKAFDALSSDMAALGQTVKETQGQFAKLGEKVDVLNDIRVELARFTGTVATALTELTDFKKRAESLFADGARAASELGSLRAWTKWALGMGVTLILLLGAAAAGVVRLSAEVDHTSKNLQTLDLHTRQELIATRNDTREGMNELRKTVAAMDRAIDQFRRSVDAFDKRFADQEEKISKIHAVVNDIEKSKGESYSEFMTQRSLLTKGELKERLDKKAPLRFELKLAYDSLSPVRSARPSAILAIPHDPLLDTLGFQIKVKKLDDNTLIINVAGNEVTLDAIESFLKSKNGAIPLDLTIRTPIDR